MRGHWQDGGTGRIGATSRMRGHQQDGGTGRIGRGGSWQAGRDDMDSCWASQGNRNCHNKGERERERGN